jgi:hypothetical protein
MGKNVKALIEIDLGEVDFQGRDPSMDHLDWVDFLDSIELYEVDYDIKDIRIATDNEAQLKDCRQLH